MAREVKKECEEVFDQLDTKTLGIGKGDCPGLLGQINVVRHQLHIKERWNETQLEISQLKQLDITQMDKWLIKPNLQLQSTKFEKGKIEDRLPKIQRKLYVFEAKDTTEPSRILVQFLNRCIECFGPSEGSAVIHQVARAGFPEEPPKNEQAVLIHAEFSDSAGPEKAPFPAFPLL
jgi:hypothetical protein